jgi:NAD(P)-dependent dehydrogenase (short-subunit alcohol dehydrogenase family)
VAVVTGGGSGIGAGLCASLVARGATVYCVDRNEVAARRTCKPLGEAARPVQIDVTDASALDGLAKRVARDAKRLHLLFANAGVLRGGLGVGDDPELLRLHFDVNVMGVANSIHALLPVLRDHDEPAHVVTTASIGGWLAAPEVGAYCASKFAVVGLSEAIRPSLAAEGIGLSVLCPGAVRTQLLTQPEATRDGGAEPPGMGEAIEGGLDPEIVAEITLRGVQAGQASIFTHAATFGPALEHRFEAVLADMKASAEPPGS